MGEEESGTAPKKRSAHMPERGEHHARARSHARCPRDPREIRPTEVLSLRWHLEHRGEERTTCVAEHPPPPPCTASSAMNPFFWRAQRGRGTHGSRAVQRPRRRPRRRQATGTRPVRESNADVWSSFSFLAVGLGGGYRGRHLPREDLPSAPSTPYTSPLREEREILATDTTPHKPQNQTQTSKKTRWPSSSLAATSRRAPPRG